MEKYINTPIDDKIVSELKAGDYVYLTGTVYTARYAAHKRLYGHLLPEKVRLLDLPVRQRAAAWINTHHYCLKKDLKV